MEHQANVNPRRGLHNLSAKLRYWFVYGLLLSVFEIVILYLQIYSAQKKSFDIQIDTSHFSFIQNHNIQLSLNRFQ